MANAEPRSGSSPVTPQCFEFVAEVGETLRVPEQVRERLAALGARRLRVTLTLDDRPDELVARGIAAGSIDAITAATGLESAIVVRALGAEGAAADDFAARLREHMEGRR